MKLSKPITLDVLHVLQNLSAASREEIFALQFGDDEEALAKSIVDNFGPVCAVAWGDNPIAVVGASEVRPGVWETFMFATDDLDTIMLPLTRFIKRELIPLVQRLGAHRMETRALSSHFPAIRWLRSLGAQQETILEKFGRDKEDFTLLKWIF